MRARLLVAVGAAVVLMVVAVAWIVSIGAAPERPAGASWRAGPAQSPDPPSSSPPPLAEPIAVVIDTPGYWSWAVMDRTTGQVVDGPDPAGTNTTESMIKAWIVADHLRRHTERDEEPPAQVLELASAAIRVSDDAAAQHLYVEGGGDDVVQRLIDVCQLTDTAIYPYWWSRTEMTARDAVRMGLCLADGRAAGPEWTEWVLAQMRQVRGTTDPANQPHGGRWGIIDALPPELAERVAIKNGWTAIPSDSSWHVNCLAIADDWILAVQARFPVDLGLEHGAGICRDVARQVLVRFGVPSPD